MDAIDVIIPTHDAPSDRLGRAIDSSLALSPQGRVFVVDDGSAKPVSVEHDRVTLLRHVSARGPSAARNAGLERADTPWIAMLDDDDEWVGAGALAAIELGERLGAGAVVVARDELHGGRVVPKPVPALWADRALPAAGDVFKPIRLFGATGVLLRREVARAARFDETLWIGEDRDFLRQIAKSWPIAASAATALRMTIRQDGNLSSPAHMERRVRDHVVIMDRWHDAESAPHFDEATRWLLKQAARCGVSSEAWSLLVRSARAHGIATPLKARVRRWLHVGAAT